MYNTNNEELESSIVSLVVEAWRFSRVFRDILPKLNEQDFARCQGRYSWFCRRLDEITGSIGLRIVEITPGTDYDPGMAVTPFNLEDFDAEEPLQVDNMLEPVIMRGDSVLKTGTVMLRRAEK